MQILRWLLTVGACAVAARGSTDLALEQGKAIFRSNCAFCHGLNGRGGRGPDLTARLAHGDSDEALKRVIRAGVPGTTMPAFDRFEDDELDKLVRFVRQLGGGAQPEPVTGNAERGRQVYQRSGCGACHRTGLDGSVYGPDLTRIGAARPVSYLRQSLVEPSADVPAEFEGVTAVTASGKRITGLRVNEDTFSLQMREPSGAFRMFVKSELREVIHEKKSLMPAYTSMPKQDLDDLLAYLAGLRGNLPASGVVKKAEGIR